MLHEFNMPLCQVFFTQEPIVKSRMFVMIKQATLNVHGLK